MYLCLSVPWSIVSQLHRSHRILILTGSEAVTDLVISASVSLADAGDTVLQLIVHIIIHMS